MVFALYNFIVLHSFTHESSVFINSICLFRVLENGYVIVTKLDATSRATFVAACVAIPITTLSIFQSVSVARNTSGIDTVLL